jgi:hypothetical protein
MAALMPTREFSVRPRPVTAPEGSLASRKANAVSARKKRVADSRRVLARMAFLRALAEHSDAIRDLHSQRAARNADDHRFGNASERSLFLLAGRRRVRAVNKWAERWKVSVSWLHAWGTYALWRWEVGSTCNATIRDVSIVVAPRAGMIHMKHSRGRCQMVGCI